MNAAAQARSPQPPADADCGVGAIKPRWAHSVPDQGDYGDGKSPNLQPRHIHLWAVDFGSDVVNLASSHAQPQDAWLTAPELARAERYRNRTQRAMYLAGRIALRRLLGAYAGLANDDLRFASGARGKPSLSNQLRGGELCFNYTLSGGKALYAFAWNRQVGIDMETLPRTINAARLAQRKLAPVEQRAWHAVPAQWRDQAMLACWTRKESYGKALGLGIRYHINQVPVCADLDSPIWQCAVTGQFHSQSQDTPPHQPTLHGIQLALPFPGIAALVHDGDALASPAAGDGLRAWQWRATCFGTGSAFARQSPESIEQRA